SVLPFVRASRRGFASGVIFTGVGLGVVASGTLVPLLLQLGLTQAWLALGGLSFVLTWLAWSGWPPPATATSASASASASASVGVDSGTAAVSRRADRQQASAEGQAIASSQYSPSSSPMTDAASDPRLPVIYLVY